MAKLMTLNDVWELETLLMKQIPLGTSMDDALEFEICPTCKKIYGEEEQRGAFCCPIDET